ncbi:hypothetical protein LIA77_03335 [Sarocladium implicatum]|nr:hypothetical protein LIA77_03335 [Sarocladium implicatum]
MRGRGDSLPLRKTLTKYRSIRSDSFGPQISDSRILRYLQAGCMRERGGQAATTLSAGQAPCPSRAIDITAGARWCEVLPRLRLLPYHSATCADHFYALS